MSLPGKGLVDQHLIRQNMHQLSDQLESLQNWEKGMKEDDRKRTAALHLEGQLDNEKNNSSEKNSKVELAAHIRYKQEGNKCFQVRNFPEAISNYNRAINSANISPQETSILYSNRAQAEILLHMYTEAVESCNKAIQLDANTVKPWFRLMTAQYKLQKYDASLAAGKRVLELSPINDEALKHVQKLLALQPAKRAYTSLLDGQGEDVEFVDKPPHQRSRVPLKRLIVANPVEKTEVESDVVEKTTPVVDEKHVVAVVNAAQPAVPKTIDMDFIEKTTALPANSSSSTVSFAKSNKNVENSAIRSDQLLCRPISSSEFCREWRSKRSAADRFAYLRIIPCEDLPKLLDSMLDSDMLSQLLQIFAGEFVVNDVPPIDYLLQMTRCKELSILSLMQTPEDHQALKTIVEYTKRRSDRVIREVSKGFSM